LSRVDDIFAAAIAAHSATLARSRADIERAAGLLSSALQHDAKLLAFGNGGSAADAQHLASELVNRFQRTRRALAAVSLTADSSVLTSIANDTSYDRVFVRQIEALGRAGDVAVGITTSGRSANVVKGLEQARAQRLTTIAMVGADAALVAPVADICILVPAAPTARIQEVHRTILHVLCELVEQLIEVPGS
jgi:D-sedoheptulose 7-phosphate isomerase